MNWWQAILAVAVSFAVFFFLTKPDDLQNHRWLRIGCSLPFALFAVSYVTGVGDWRPGGPLFLLSVGALGAMWVDVISHYASGSMVDFLHRDISSATGMVPDYHYAKNHRRDGEMKEALAAVQHELKKEPRQFEGLILLAEIHQDLNQPNEALAALQGILTNPDATPEQMDVARSQQANCFRLQQQLEAARNLGRKG